MANLKEYLTNWADNKYGKTTAPSSTVQGTVIKPGTSTYKEMASSPATDKSNAKAGSSMMQAYTDAGSSHGNAGTKVTGYVESSAGGGGGGGGNPTTTSAYDYSALIEALQRISQEKYSALENALLRNKQLSDDQANAQYARNLRQWKRTYGNGLTGEGLSQKFGLMANRDSTLAQNQTDYLNNVATAKSGKYDDYSNLTSSLSGIDSTSLKKILSLI